MKSISANSASFAILIFCVVPVNLSAAENYVVPKTEWQAPDLQGTWSIATQTNLGRAQRFDGKLIILSEEGARIGGRVAACNEASNAPSDAKERRQLRSECRGLQYPSGWTQVIDWQK